MLLGYGNEVSEIMINTELFYYVEQDTQDSTEEIQQTPEEVQGTTGVTDEELSILF